MTGAANNILALLDFMVVSEPSVPVSSAADELLKYKQLLDCGLLTEEEFLEKKKQLLNL